MATTISQWEQTGIYDPLNPNQKSYLYYTAIPGGYGSFYYNRVPTTVKLAGALGVSIMPNWVQAALVGVAGLAVGYVGMRYAAPKLKAKGLLGPARRRRRR